MSRRQVRRTKYGNRKAKVDDILFDSRKEANTYVYLQRLEQDGKIHSLKCQVPFTFNVNGVELRYVDSKRVMKYVADFDYFTADGVRKIVDVKGFKTRDYLIKKALMLACHGILVEEI